MLQLDAEPEGVVEKVGDAAGVLKRRVKGDLERFKELIESRGTESGAWRGGGPERHALNVAPCPGARPSHPR